MPTVNWPNRCGDYLAVQLEIDGKPYLRFEIGLHAFVMQEALKEFGISDYDKTVIDSHPNGIVDMGQQRLVYEVPSPIGKRYHAVGMERADINELQKEAIFFGYSEDYNIGYCQLNDIFIY